MRRAQITTTHDDETVAARVAAAVAPDNTDEMVTRADGDSVVTTVERETTGGLRSTVDDYAVNLTVATRLSGDGDSIERTNTTTDDTEAATDDTTDINS